MQLVDRGIVALDEPVAGYLPDVDLGRFEGTPAALLITPRMLLSMSSGLDNGRYVDTGDDRDAVAKGVDLIRESELTFQPGTAWAYTNASTNVSGLLVERMTGMPWDACLQERILTPAGLADSTTSLRRQVVGPTAVGYLAGDGPPRQLDEWIFGRGYGPAGSTLTSTAGDLLRFASIFLAEGRAESGTEILSPEAVAQMQTPQIAVPNRSVADYWGLGPAIKERDGRRAIGHPGGNISGGSQLYWVPDAGGAVAVLCNMNTLTGPFTERVMGHVLSERFGIANRVPPEELPAVAAPLDYVGEYVRDGIRMRVTSEGGSLTASIVYDVESGAGPDAVAHVEEFAMLPVGGDAFRFRNSDGVVLRPADRAFVRDADGRVQYFLDPWAAVRRIERPSLVEL